MSEKIRAFAFGTNDKLISFIGICLKHLHLLKAIQRISTFKSLKKVTPITTTSVSVLFIMTFLHPHWRHLWCVSASSCVQGENPSVLIAMLLTPFSPFVATILFAASVITIYVARNSNNLSRLNKLFQLPGRRLEPTTLRQIPVVFAFRFLLPLPYIQVH